MRLIMKLTRPYAIREKCDVLDSEAFSVALLHFVEIIPQFDPTRSSFSTFLHLTLTQKLWKLYRKKNPAVAWTDEYEATVQASEEENLYDQNLIDKLRLCLNCFEDNSRGRLILSMRLDGQTYREIAEVLGCTRANVEAYFKRAVMPVLIEQFAKELSEDVHD